MPTAIVHLAGELEEDELAKVCHELGTRPSHVEAVLERRQTYMLAELKKLLRVG